LKNLPYTLPSLSSIVNRKPAIADPEMLLSEAIYMMSQNRGNKCLLPSPGQSTATEISLIEAQQITESHSAVLVLEQKRLVGIFTKQDLVRLTSTQTDLRGIKIGAVMTKNPYTLSLSSEETVISALGILEQYKIRHLSIIDDQAQLIGTISSDAIRQILQPIDLLRFRSVQEGMTVDVVQAAADTNVLELTRLMVTHRVSSVVITEGNRPIGIITEQDIVQFQLLELDFDQLNVCTVMSMPLFCLQPTDSLWMAQQMMESKLIRRLVVIDAQGELCGIVTHSNLLKSLDPLEMVRIVDSLQAQLMERATELEQTNAELRSEIARRQQVENRLNRASQSLEERMAIRVAEALVLTERVELMKLDKESVDTALAISQQGVSDFMKNAVIGIHWVDQQGIILWANSSELEMLGYESEEYIGLALHSFHVDRTAVGCAFQRLLDDEPVIDYESQMIRKDGSICDVSIDANAFFKDGKFIHARCFTRDISEQKQAEAALRQNERKFRAIFNGAFGFVGLLDIDGIVLETNHTTTNAMGSATSIIGQPFGNTVWWNHSPALQLKLQDAIGRAAAGERVRFESNHNLADGSHIIVDFSISPIFDGTGQVVMLIPEGRDITTRKAGEQQICEQAAMLNVATDAIIVRDLVDFKIKFWNDGAKLIYGWSAAEVIGLKTTIEIFQKDPDQVDMTPLEILRQQGVWQGELRKLTKHGKEVIVESRCSLVRDAAGNPKSILSVETDITAKKQLEQQFFRAQRLESLGTLASGIAHDLNNILTPILGVAQLLPLTLPILDDRNQRLLTMLVESSKRGSGLVKQILAFAKGLDSKPTMLQVRHILAEIISVAHQTFPKSIEVTLDIEREELWMVCVDATQIHQVLMNLFVNARDAMPEGGVITATARNIMLDKSYVKLHPQVSVGAYIIITIADTGIGMDSATVDQIFDSFFTTKESGTGLGLSTVLGIIKAHGGFIDVQSKLAEGSSFNVYLPAVKTLVEEQLITTPELFDGKGQLILVVDDEASIRQIAKDSLEVYNYHSMLANNGVEALTLYAQNWQRIAIVVVDMMMPYLDTSSVIQALQQINPAVKIIVMSGSENNEKIVEQYGLQSFLPKPFTTIEMMHALADCSSKSV
jgi:PAS domain S-box-containing protein